MNPQEHQRNVGEKEHYPPQEQPKREADQRDEYIAHKRQRDKRNNTHRNEQTGHQEAEARRVKEEAKKRAA